ncbi:patatin-like phospholipase family protein [bacterium]|nr:MAG: patatin-like phospholipase family protein [bacterium]
MSLIHKSFPGIHCFGKRHLFAGILTGFFLSFLLMAGCASYQVNKALDQYSPDTGYRPKNMGIPENSEELLLILTFSGGGTRAAAFSYGLLEELAKTEVYIDGKKRRLLDEVDVISGVSGGSFTAAYYGLFGDRIFEDFEERFLRRNIQGALVARKFFFIPNWFRLMSPNFDASDIAAELYDKEVFDGGTFGDIASRGGPAILINATDLTEGTTFPFIQEYFDFICSDLTGYPVARATAASSAVPVVLTPITLKNYRYERDCGYMPKGIHKALKERDKSRRYYQALHISPYLLEPEKKRYVHLVDGGIADNLGLRIASDRVTQMGNAWTSLKYSDQMNTRKVVFIVVNAETGVDKSPDLKRSPAGTLQVLGSVTSTPLSRYNFETIELLRSDFKTWGEDIRTGRCSDPDYKGDAESCGDIAFYLVEVDFNDIPDEKERTYFLNLPTSFKLDDETVDNLREIAGRLLNQSPEFQKLLGDLR